MLPDYGKFKVHPIADRFDLLPDDEFRELVQDIGHNGLQSAIVLAGDNLTIVDGRNRYLACVEARVDPRYVSLPSTFSE
jgi:ParB-like chromosome segregation protein Spo0J